MVLLSATEEIPKTGPIIPISCTNSRERKNVCMLEILGTWKVLNLILLNVGALHGGGY
jgi:hypothetical protein